VIDQLKPLLEPALSLTVEILFEDTQRQAEIASRSWNLLAWA